MSRLVTFLYNLFGNIRRHKYLITVLAFGVIIVFLDENNLIRRYENMREIRTLNEEIAKYRKMYEEDTKRLNELNSNPGMIEKIAREKYLMRNPDEDVYIFEENEQ